MAPELDRSKTQGALTAADGSADLLAMARPDETFSYTNGIPAERIASTLLTLRESAGLDRKTVARKSDVPVRRLRRWESGEEIPADVYLEAYATACESTPTELFPVRDRMEFDRKSTLMRVGAAVVSIVDASNEVVLQTYLRLVRQQRGLWPDDSVQLRGSDIDMLSSVLDLRDDCLEDRLVSQIGMSPAAAAELRFRMIRRRHPSAGPV